MPRTPGAQQPQAKDMYWFAHGGMEPASGIQHPVRSTTPGPGDTEDESSESGSLSWKVNSERRAASEEPSSLKSDQQDGSSLSSTSQRSNFSEKRQAVEERKRLLLEAEQERNDAIMKKHIEREAVFEAKRNAQRNNISFAFGSSVSRSSESDGSRVLQSPDAEKPRMPPTSLYNLPPRTADNIMSQSLFLPTGSARGRRKNDLTPTIPYDRTGPPRTAHPSRKRSVSMSRLDQLAQPRRAYIEAQKANSTISNSSSKDARQSPTRPLSFASEKTPKQSKAPSTATSVTRRPPTATRKPRPVSIAGTIPDHSPQKPESKATHQQATVKNKKAEHPNTNGKTHTSQLRAPRAKSSSSERTPKPPASEKQVIAKTPKTKTAFKPPARHSTPKQATPPKSASPKQWTPKTSPARKLLTNKKQAAMLVPIAVEGAANAVGEVAMQPPSPIRSGTPDDDSQSADEKNVSKRIVSEEEAKAALAEKRRLAREQAEKEAELEKQRQEELNRQEEERLRQEEEEHKQMEEEQLRLADEHRKFEEEKLRKAIEEQERKEEEEKAKKEEETRIKAEQEKKAKEEAEKQRIELEEKLRKEEGERAERKKRLEKIMSRTRGKSGTASPGSASGSEAPDSTESQPEILSSEPNSLDSNIAVESLPMDNPPLEEPSGSESLDYNQTMNLDSQSLSSNDLMLPSSGHTSIDGSLPNTVNEGQDVAAEQHGAEEKTPYLDTSIEESEGEDMSSVTQPVTELAVEKHDSEGSALDNSIVTPAIESSIEAVLSTENICEAPAAPETTVEDSMVKSFVEEPHGEVNVSTLKTAVVEEPFSRENVSLLETTTVETSTTEPVIETSTSEPIIELHVKNPSKVEDADIELVVQSMSDRIFGSSQLNSGSIDKTSTNEPVIESHIEGPLEVKDVKTECIAQSMVDQIVGSSRQDTSAIDSSNFETTVLNKTAESVDLPPHEEVPSMVSETNFTEDLVQPPYKKDSSAIVETNFIKDPIVQPSCQEQSSVVVEDSVVQPLYDDSSAVEAASFVATVVDKSTDDPIVEPSRGNSSHVGDILKSSIEDDTLVSSVKLDPLNDSVEAELDEVNQISEQIAANVEGLIMQSLNENQFAEPPISGVEECIDIKESSILTEKTRSTCSSQLEGEKEYTITSSGDEVLIRAEDKEFVLDSTEKKYKNELNAFDGPLISNDHAFTADQSFVAEPETLNESNLAVDKDDSVRADELNLSHADENIPYVDPESIHPVVFDGNAIDVMSDDQNAFDAKVREASSQLEDEEGNIPYDENNSANPDPEVLLHHVKNQSFIAPTDPSSVGLVESILETNESVQDNSKHLKPLDEVSEEALSTIPGLQDNTSLSGAQDHINLTEDITKSETQSDFVEPSVEVSQQLEFSSADPVIKATNIENDKHQLSHGDDLSSSTVPPSEQNVSQVADLSTSESEFATEDTVNVSQSIPVENSATANPFTNTSSNSSHGIEFGGEVDASLERFADHGVLKTVDEMNFTNLEETNRSTTSFLYSYEEAVPTDVVCGKEKSEEGGLLASSALDFHQEFSSQDQVHSIINQNLEAGDGDSSLQFGHDFFIGESKLENSNAENPFEDSTAHNICEAVEYSDNFTLAQRTFNPFSDTENYTGDADVQFPPSEIISDQVLSPYGESDIGKELLMNALNSAIDESEDSSLDSNLSQVLKVESIDAPISNLDNLNSKTEILDNSLSTIATPQTAVDNKDYSVFPAQEDSVIQRTNGYNTTYNNGCLYDDRFESVEYKADQTPVSSKDLDPEHPVSEKGINANNISTVGSGNNTLDNVDNVNSNKIASNPFLVSSDSSQFSGNPFEIKEDKTVPTFKPEFSSTAKCKKSLSSILYRPPSIMEIKTVKTVS